MTRSGSVRRPLRGLAFVVGGRFVRHDTTVLHGESTRAGNADPGRSATVGLLRPFAGRLPRAETATDIRDCHCVSRLVSIRVRIIDTVSTGKFLPLLRP